jgi:hypothetical protein
LHRISLFFSQLHPVEELVGRYSGIRLLQNGNDLFFVESTLSHGFSLTLAGRPKWRSHVSNALISGVRSALGSKSAERRRHLGCALATRDIIFNEAVMLSVSDNQ